MDDITLKMVYFFIGFMAGLVFMFFIERILDSFDDRPEVPEHLKGTLAELYDEVDANEGLTRKGRSYETMVRNPHRHQRQ